MTDASHRLGSGKPIASWPVEVGQAYHQPLPMIDDQLTHQLALLSVWLTAAISESFLFTSVH